MRAIDPPYYPIIYVRGYAMGSQDIAETVATPYMGFNDGSMKRRHDARARAVRYPFESPLVRLMKDKDYRDVYGPRGEEWIFDDSPRVLVIHRYYEDEDSELGSGYHKTVPEAARDLGRLILELRDRMYGKKASEARASFGVHLVAHSMGGLICRSLLQNPDSKVGRFAKPLIRRVFSYATPHNGIQFRKLRIPDRLSWLGLENQFSHGEIAGYLAIDAKRARVDTLQGAFPARQFFCLVGTNHRDYHVARDAARLLVGPESDGLVKIDNARLKDPGSAAAYVHRSHSGHYGIVNSEEGYANLVSFLFAGWRIDGGLNVEGVPLPPSLGGDRREGLTVQTAHQIEVAVAPLGSTGYRLTERRILQESAIVLREAQLVRVEGERERPSGKAIELFTIFAGGDDQESVFNVELAVSPTEYAIDGRADPRRFIPGEYLFQDTIRVRLERNEDSWTLRHALTNRHTWGELVRSAAEEDAPARSLAEKTAPLVFSIPLETEKFRGTLIIEVSRVIDEPIVPQGGVDTIGRDAPPGDSEAVEAGGQSRRKKGKKYPVPDGSFNIPPKPPEVEETNEEPEPEKREEEEEEKKEEDEPVGA